MIKVAVLDDYQDISRLYLKKEKFKKEVDFKVFNNSFHDEEEVIKELNDFDAIFLMRERTIINKKIINSLKKLKYIFTSGMRNKAIDIEAAKKKNIIVCGTEINSNPASELTWLLILGLARNFRQETDNRFQGYWQTTIGLELKGKVLGIIGLGKIGSQVAKIGNAFGMQIISWSENLDLDHARKINVLPVSKEDILKNSDFISIHLVLGDRYKNLITKKDLIKMKKTSYLINTSRGPIINEDDLVKALENNLIAGVGLDVYNYEPLPENHKLRFLPNALLLPHLGFVTEENYFIFYSQMVENLNSCLEGKPLRVIN